jgi:hypothetical protein
MAIKLPEAESGEIPEIAEVKIQGLPIGIDFRPHGIFIDRVLSKLYCVHHSTKNEVEGVAVFDIQEDSTRLSWQPVLTFRYILVSSEFKWFGVQFVYMLNDVAAVAGENEIYVSALGPVLEGDLSNVSLGINRSAQDTHLWRCTWNESNTFNASQYDSSLALHMKADCQAATPAEKSGTWNGITINTPGSQVFCQTRCQWHP